MSALVAIGFFAMLLVVALLMRGIAWVSEKAFPRLITAGRIAFDICVLVLLPLSIFRKTRPWAGVGLYYASFPFGILLFAFSCLYVVYTWGYVALAIGLVFAGVGVLPVALLAALFHAGWSVLLELLFGIALTFGTRALGIRLGTGHPTREEVFG